LLVVPPLKMHKQPATQRRQLLLPLITIASVLCTIPAVAGWYFSPLLWWPLGVCSIAFAYVWPALLLLLFWWFKKNSWVTGVLLLLLIAGWQPAAATYSLGMNRDFEITKKPSALRVMQWNCMDFAVNYKGHPVQQENRRKISSFIQQYSPDILCIQDFSEIIGKHHYSNFSFLRDSLGYKHLLFAEHSNLIEKYGKVYSGTLIASKLPFVQTGAIPFEGRNLPESITWADILFQGENIRIVSTHFRSMHIFSHKDFNRNSLPYYHLEDSAIILSSNILKKIKFFQHEHAVQAQQLRNFLDTSGAPVILGADMNTVPASYIYKKVKGSLNDGFTGSRTGLGATYNYLLPNLRIDYLLNDGRLAALQWKHFNEGFFDHDHLMADYEWQPQ
jgi:endonuclease/exonuclease/phosphatase family metal-dependent hydrolase